MPLTRISRAGVLRVTGVLVITAAVSIAAACSDEDTVDTIPPPWPTPTIRSLDDEPQAPTGARAPTPSGTSAPTPPHPTPTHPTSTSRR
ncbi:MAG: hypothetical protein L0H79_06715 [Intrasporangium sp.]|uniref:hypothetical protein n=1 Tax=Intrasporangium sp. TaxID=1925024 RepID=UPI002649DFC7|nr:hypothetical protein [Intrasporangium sp.]MDN5795429.1 hypothetical protein [Intrasporangium sp.]